MADGRAPDVDAGDSDADADCQASQIAFFFSLFLSVQAISQWMLSLMRGRVGERVGPGAA